MTPEAALARIHALGRFGELGLERMERLMARLHHPERAFRAFHVAGTNGKGSVGAHLEALLRPGGRVGFTSSPHLAEVGERVRVDGRPADPGALARWLEVNEGALCDPGGEAVTEFEALTAWAFDAFRAAGVTDAVVEVGLGGRLDATNVLPPPAVAVITPIGLDHMDRLGPTLAAIAGEKAGIIKTGGALVVARQPDPAARVIAAAASRAGVVPRLEGRDFGARRIRVTEHGTRFDLVVGQRRFRDLRTPLLGRHQAHNAAVAAAALDAVDPERLERALAAGALDATVWPGRLEVVADSPPVVLDGAHNPHATRTLARAVGEIWPGRRATLVFGMLEDRDSVRVISPLLPIAERVILTRPPSARARDPESMVGRLPGVALRVEADPWDALTRARELTPGDGLVLVTGSLYLVGAIRARLRSANL